MGPIITFNISAPSLLNSVHCPAAIETFGKLESNGTVIIYTRLLSRFISPVTGLDVISQGAEKGSSTRTCARQSGTEDGYIYISSNEKAELSGEKSLTIFADTKVPLKLDN